MPARWEDRGRQGVGSALSCEGCHRSLQLAFATFLIQGVRTCFQNPQFCPLPLLSHPERLPSLVGRAKRSPLFTWLPPFSPQCHLKTNLVGFFFFYNTVSKQLLQQIAADGPAGCGRGWQLPSAGAWPLGSSRSTKISSPCSPSEDAAYRGSGRPGHVWLGALSGQRKPPWFPFLLSLLSRANKCF